MEQDNHDLGEANAQLSYDAWTTSRQAEACERYNAPGINSMEKELIGSLKPDNLVDIGCGTGKRTFPFYKTSGIRVIGIEKFMQFIDASPYCDDILIGDIGAEVLPILIQSHFGKFDVAAMWGGTFCGIHTKKGRMTAFENIAHLLKKKGHLILDTLRIHEIDFEHGVRGSIQKKPDFRPPQYFCTLPELSDLATRSGFNLVANLRRSVMIPSGEQIEYLVFQKTGALSF